MTCTTSHRAATSSSSAASRAVSMEFSSTRPLMSSRASRASSDLLDEVLPDAVLADVDDGVDVVGQAPQLGSLFACQFHIDDISYDSILSDMFPAL